MAARDLPSHRLHSSRILSREDRPSSISVVSSESLSRRMRLSPAPCWPARGASCCGCELPGPVDSDPCWLRRIESPWPCWRVLDVPVCDCWPRWRFASLSAWRERDDCPLLRPEELFDLCGMVHSLCCM